MTQKNRIVITIDDPYLTPEEAADYLRVHVDTLYKLIKKGVMVLGRDYFRPKHFKAIRFKKSALDRLMSESGSDAETLADELLKNVC